MKYYYSISEVAEKTEVKPYVLRYWEQEFKELRPKKTKGGRRIYTAKDINLIFIIKKLLYEDHYTIEGVREKLRNNRIEGLPKESTNLQDKMIDISKLKEIEKGLKELLNILS